MTRTPKHWGGAAMALLVPLLWSTSALAHDPEPKATLASEAERFGRFATALESDCKNTKEQDPQLGQVCRDLCGGEAIIDVCALAVDEGLALAASAGAGDDLVRIESLVEAVFEARDKDIAAKLVDAKDRVTAAEAKLVRQRDALDRVKPQAKAEAEAEVARAEAELEGALSKLTEAPYRALDRHFADPARLSPAAAGLSLSADFAAFAMRAAVALGKLALDRAKQEAVIWAIGEIETSLCSPADEPRLGIEMSRYWLPHTCSFATKKIVESSYGAGNDMLVSLVSALEHDMRGLPGASAGLVLGGGFWAEAGGGTLDDMLGCDAAEPTCTSTNQVRLAVGDAVDAVVRGHDPFSQYREFARRFDAIDREGKTRVEQPKLGGYFHAPAMQVATCAGSVATELSVDQNPAKLSALESVVVALVRTPACWSLVGEGYDLVAQPNGGSLFCGPGADESCPVPRLAVLRSVEGDVERLSTVIRVYQVLSRSEHEIRDSWDRIEDLRGRIAALRKVTGDIAKGKRAGPGHGTKFERFRRLMFASLDVAEQGVVTGEAVTELLDHVARDTPTSIHAVLPGLTPGSATHDEIAAMIPFEEIRTDLARTKEVVMATKAVIAGEWPSVSLDILTFLHGVVRKDDKRAVELVDRFASFSGVLVSVLEAEDADELAGVLAKTASPPGLWRRKQVPGAFTLSLGAQVGVLGGVELRYGQYGASYERGTVRAVAPTVSIPLGVDIAFGSKRRFSNGLFISLIDPAAFLQYDISEAGRLPGPRPLTIVALGASYRLGIRNTPLSLLLGYIYRPQLRTWSPTVSGPGADAHQLVFMLSVDASIWALVKRRRRRRCRKGC